VILYAVGFQIFTSEMANLELRLLLVPLGLLFFLVVAAGLWFGISHFKSQYEHERRLIFEEQRGSGFEFLELSRRE
jgi:hypothetical protein